MPEELYLSGYIIKNAPLTPLIMHKDSETLIEATLRVYPRDIDLQDLSENPESRYSHEIKNKLLKLILRKIIGKDGDEIVLMRYLLSRQDLNDGKD
jgi:hypothetical protein